MQDRIAVKAEEVEEGWALDFNVEGSYFPENYHIVESVEFGFWGDGSACVDIVFKDTNEGQPYTYSLDETLFRRIR